MVHVLSVHYVTTFLSLLQGLQPKKFHADIGWSSQNLRFRSLPHFPICRGAFVCRGLADGWRVELSSAGDGCWEPSFLPSGRVGNREYLVFHA